MGQAQAAHCCTQRGLKQTQAAQCRRVRGRVGQTQAAQCRTQRGLKQTQEAQWRALCHVRGRVGQAQAAQCRAKCRLRGRVGQAQAQAPAQVRGQPLHAVPVRVSCFSCSRAPHTVVRRFADARDTLEAAVLNRDGPLLAKLRATRDAGSKGADQRCVTRSRLSSPFVTHERIS